MHLRHVWFPASTAHPYPVCALCQSVIPKLGYRTVTNFISRSLFPLELPDLSYSIAQLPAPSSPPHRSVPTNIPQFMGRSLCPCKAYRSSSVYSLPITHSPSCTHIRNTMFYWWIVASAFLFWSAVDWMLCETFAGNELWQNSFFIEMGSWRLRCTILLQPEHAGSLYKLMWSVWWNLVIYYTCCKVMSNVHPETNASLVSSHKRICFDLCILFV